MDVKYRRMAPDEPESVELYGYTFKEGKSVSVDDKYADKMRGHPSFEVKGEETYGDEPVDLSERSRVEDAERAARAALAEAGKAETQKAHQAEAAGEKRGPGRPRNT